MHRILIVDDHSVVRRGIMDILHEELGPAEFGEAANAQEALDHVWRQPWDIVVLDIKLPGRSGLGVLQEIRAARPKTPVLVLSMHPEDQYAVRALRAGAAGYLTKETAPEALGEAVQRILAGGRYVSPKVGEKLAARLGNHEPEAPHDALSNREYEVMCLIASGRTVTEIAERLSLSVKTISTYRTRTLQKMGMKTSAELTAYAVRRGLVD